MCALDSLQQFQTASGWISMYSLPSFGHWNQLGESLCLPVFPTYCLSASLLLSLSLCFFCLSYTDSFSHQLTTFEQRCQELRRDLTTLADLRTHLVQCEKLEGELDTERKGHAEELRQINQDINNCEDMMKTLRSERESRRGSLLRKVEELENLRQSGNRTVR